MFSGPCIDGDSLMDRQTATRRVGTTDTQKGIAFVVVHALIGAGQGADIKISPQARTREAAFAHAGERGDYPVLHH